MRLIFILLNVLASSILYAQKDAHLVTDVSDIAAGEQRAHRRMINARTLASGFTNASNNFDVKYYRLDFEVDPVVNHIKGVVTAYYVMTAAGQSVSLDLDDALNVSAVLQRGAPLPSTHANHTLKIDFPQLVQTGTLDSVSIFYEGIPPSSGFGSFVLSSHGNPAIPVMWSLSEPYGSRDWWPCKNGLDDKADNGVDIYITHPAKYNTQNYRAAANGLLIGETAAPGGKIRTHWKHSYAIASYLVCFAVTNYSVFNNSVMIGNTNLPMLTYCYPESLTAFQNGTQNTLDALQLYSNLFGPYPFIAEKYGHVQFGWGGGMEHQTNSFMVNLSESLVAHELAHQWFGDKVTCGNWEDIWLNEGFASHVASIYMENKYPLQTNTVRLNEIDYITSAVGGSVKVDNVNDVNRIFSGRLSYIKGSHLIYMLRWILGDQVFFTAIKNYLNDAALAYNFSTTEKLKAHLEAVSGKDLTYFFDQWYTGQGYPSYHVEWTPGGNTVQFNLKQTTSHPSVSFFRLPVPLLFRNNTTNQQKLVVVDNTTNNQSFVENLGFEPETVTIDPDYWLITKNNIVTKLTGPLPVTFVSFNAACEEGKTVLSWETSSEENAGFFEIQGSQDALAWHKIGSIDAAGSSLVLRKYRFTDTSTDGSAIYFRVVEHDPDGKMQFTRAIVKDCAAEPTDPKIFPNPAKDYLTVEFIGNPSIQLTAGIFDVSGKMVKDNLTINSSSKTLIPVSGISSGLYIIRINSPEGKVLKSFRFLRQ